MGYEMLNLPEGSLFLVTGGAGFIGSNLCGAILRKGGKIRCVDDLSTGSMDNIAEYMEHPSFTFIEGNICDSEVCTKVCDKVDYVLHQAAWGSIPRSLEMPIVYEQRNIAGTLNMMEAARYAKVRKFVYASSSSVYGDSEECVRMEGKEGNVLSPYALTKKVNEEYGKIYSKVYGLPTVGLRYFNVFGPKQNPDGPYAAVIPRFIIQLLKNEAPVIFGDGSQTRDFTYIENVIEANLRACLSGEHANGESFNVAYGNAQTLMEVYHAICLTLNVNAEPTFGEWRAGDVAHAQADITKAKEILKYSPDYNFQCGLEKTVSWFRNEYELKTNRKY